VLSVSLLGYKVGDERFEFLQEISLFSQTSIAVLVTAKPSIQWVLGFLLWGKMPGA
jgi:hypothetical protein